MDWDVKTVRPLPDPRIDVELVDGRRGVFDLTPYLEHGVFSELKDTAYFQRAGIQHGGVTWPHDQDVAPETLVAEMQPAQEMPAWS